MSIVDRLLQNGDHEAVGKINALRAEVERLRAEIQRLRSGNIDQSHDVEIEQLRMEVQKLRGDTKRWKAAYEELTQRQNEVEVFGQGSVGTASSNIKLARKR